MKHYILFIVVGTLIFFSCASQKKAHNSLPQSNYTTDYIVPEKEKAVVTDSVAVPEIKTHIVKKGESLWVIAKKYGVTVRDLVEANHIADKNIIMVNQELIIPDKKKR